MVFITPRIEGIFYSKLQVLLSEKNDSDRNFTRTYIEIIREVKEYVDYILCFQANQNRCLACFDVINITESETLIEKVEGEMTDIKYFCLMQLIRYS